MSGMKRPATEQPPERIEVEEGSRTAVHGPKPPKPPSGRGNVFFVGPRGAGKTTLGRLVAERLDRPFTDDPGWQDLASLVKQGGQVAAIAPGLMDQEGVGALLHRGGKVFYLMADAATLAERLGAPGDVPLREQLFAELSELEPRLMQVLHFILPATEPRQELVESVVEKLSITGDA